jgi:hypothetical protein
MKVEGNISDLFFNTEHGVKYDEDGNFEEFASLEEEAKDFLDALDRLGVSTPTVAELIEDFHNRI